MVMKKLLIVDDNDMNLKLCRAILKDTPYQIYTAPSAEEGLKTAEEVSPDLILMDIQLPKMDGLTATRKLKNQDKLKDIPVIALTAFAMIGDKERAMTAGFDGYLTKPFNIQKFKSLITQVMEGKGLDHADS